MVHAIGEVGEDAREQTVFGQVVAGDGSRRSQQHEVAMRSQQAPNRAGFLAESSSSDFLLPSVRVQR